MSVDKPRCTHFTPCYCPLLAESAGEPLRRDQWSPEWLQKSFGDEDYNKDIAERMKRRGWRHIIKNFLHDIFLTVDHRPKKPEVRSFKWLISSHLVPEGYEDEQAPWRMLVRFYFMDLPTQLTGIKDQYSIKSWRKSPARHIGKLHYRTELEDESPEIKCGRRVIFSRYGDDSNQYLTGDWLVVVYLWATDCTWAEKVDVRDLVSFHDVAGMRAWEWVDAVDAPTKTPYLFYELQRGRKYNYIWNGVFGGLPYKHYNTVLMESGDPIPTRLSGLRRLMNNQARDLLYATYENT